MRIKSIFLQIFFKMKLLSITFHAIESVLPIWEQYIDEQLPLLIDNLMYVERFLLSEIATEMLSEGENYNLLLVFENEEIRADFLQNEFLNIVEHIEMKFQDKVMIFPTEINPIKGNI